MDKETNEIQQVVEHFSEGIFASDAVEQVHEWLLLNKDYERKKEAWKSVWVRTESTGEDVETSLASTYRRAAEASERLRQEHSRRRRIFLRIAASAAAAVLIVLTSAVTFRLSERHIRQTTALSSVTAVDSARVVCLPDGSTVRLKRGTTLLYPARFGRDGRDVQLVGEAWFDVKKESGKPFRVHTRGTQVVVRGTTFNLKAYPDRNLIEAVLATGAVDFVASGRVVSLEPSQKLIYDTRDDGVKVEFVNLAKELKTNILVFRGGSLSDATAIISRVFEYPVRLDNPELGRIEISGTITIDGDNSLRHALDILTLTTDTRYRADDGEMVIYR